MLSTNLPNTEPTLLTKLPISSREFLKKDQLELVNNSIDIISIIIKLKLNDFQETLNQHPQKSGLTTSLHQTNPSP